jgi:CubicO group peptidase (beta-lactamase class C family)
VAVAAAVDSDALRAWLDTVDFSGVIHIADASSDAPAVTICRGLADRSAGVPITSATRFGTASTTKLITGLAAARLVDRGRLSYDARVVDLLDAASRPRNLDAAVTLGHLLSHTSGIGDYADDLDGPPYETIWESTPPGTIRRPADLLPLLRNVPPRAAPGDEVRYNNGAFVLAGLALEAVTGQPYPALVRDEVFTPLGMTSSGFWPLDGVEPHLAVGYLPPDPDAVFGVKRLAWQTNVHAIPALGQPDGGAQATAGDLVRLLDGLTGRGAADGYLSGATRTVMRGPHATDPRTGARYGFGVVHAGAGQGARLGHGGDDPGFACRAYAYPELDLRVVVMSNVTEGAATTFRHIDGLIVGPAG